MSDETERPSDRAPKGARSDGNDQVSGGNDRVPDRSSPVAAVDQLAAVRSAFERGDYMEVRRLTAAITDPQERALAHAYFRRTRPDPLVRYILLVSLVLLVAVTVFAYSGQ